MNLQKSPNYKTKPNSKIISQFSYSCHFPLRSPQRRRSVLDGTTAARLLHWSFHSHSPQKHRRRTTPEPSASATLWSLLRFHRRRSPRGPTSILTASGLLKNLKSADHSI